MDRRDFLRAASWAGLSLFAPFGRARAEPYTGLFFVNVHASGGWDPTSLCDPKGRASPTESDPLNMSLASEIASAGNIRYAPVPGLREFFDRHHARLLVINGIDTETNGHDSGTRNTWSGRLAEGLPSSAALLAGALGAERPLSFVSFGGFDRTMGIVAPTRTGNTAVLARIAHPDRIDPNVASGLYHHPETEAAIEAARAERLARPEVLPLRREAKSALLLARAGENDIQRLTEHLPELDQSPNPLFRQAQLAVASYKAGLTVSANLSYGGFDTHGNHDQNHFPRLATLMAGVGFLFDEAERQGVLDKMVVVVGSDFGRTPRYNAQMGKDHWSITSMILAGPGIPGNRVIGATTERHRPLTVNPSTLALDPAGVRITPAHVHRALRRLAGVAGSELDRRFPLPGADLPLFA